jgi:3-oxoacyl-[acyl-carrier-protein] synthase II
MQLLNIDRVSQLAMLAAKRAVADAGLEHPEDLGENTGVYFGTGMGGAESTELAYAKFFNAGGEKKKLLTIPAAMTHAPASQVALAHGVRGECQTYSTACSSSAVAIGEAYRRIRDGHVTLALTGGAECVLTPGILDSWAAMRVLCSDPADAPGTGCRPFSADRTGFAIGEGAAVLVLENLDHARARRARALAEVVGFGVSNDATHITKPCPVGQALAMRRALDDARVGPADIGYINAHGTATRAGDVAETRAIKTVFDDKAYEIPISATKSAHGHLMGATGAVEFLAMVLALGEQCVPPTTHWTVPDPECDLDYVPGMGREIEGLEYALSNSFAFGGNNAVLIARRWSGD